jgi:hypothetical protein
MENITLEDADLPLLKRYYLAQTTEAEDAEIQTRLQTDDDFKEKAQLYQTLLWTVEDWENRYIQAHEAGELQTNEPEKEARVVPLRLWRSLALVACVALLVVAVWWNLPAPALPEAMNSKGVSTMGIEGKAQGFDVVSPEHNQVFQKNETIVFRIDSAKPCVIKVRDAQEKVWEVVKLNQQQKQQAINAKNLPTGKFTWTLYNAENKPILERVLEVLP